MAWDTFIADFFQPEAAAEEREYVKRKAGEAEESQKTISMISEDFQAFLLGNFGKVVTDNATKQKDKITPSYNSILTHEADGPSSAVVSQMANPSVISEFIEATPAMLGILTPRIEFYKVTKDKNGEGKSVTEEFIFSDHVSGERMAQLGRARTGTGRLDGYGEGDGKDEILNRAGLATDVGIKEFTWMFDNKHDGDKTIKASVTIFFGSIIELASNADWYSFIFNANTPEEDTKDEKDKAKILTEIKKRFGKMKAEDLSKFQKESQKDKVKAFRQIKVRVGWSRPERQPEDGILANLNAEQLKRFYDSVEATQKTILLNLTQYKLTFGQEGQVELLIDYVGSLDSIVTDPDKSNIFTRTNDALSKSNIVIPRAASFKESTASAYTPSFVQDLGITDKSFDGTNLLKDKAFGFKSGELGAEKELTGNLAKQLKKPSIKTRFLAPGVITNIAALEYEEKTLRMARQYLRELGLEKSEKNQKQLKKIDDGIVAIQQASFQANTILAQDRFSQFYESFYANNKLRYVTVEVKAGEIKVKKGGTINRNNSTAEDNVMIGNARKKFKAKMEEKRKRDAGIEEKKEDKDKEKKDDKEPAGIKKDSKFKIMYVTVGDILDIASTDQSGKSFKIFEDVGINIMLGSFNGLAAGITTKPANYSIADIPITMDSFGNWFLENFTGGNPPRAKISFRLFLNKLLNNLVAPTMNQQFADSGGKAKINFSMATVSYPRSAPKLKKPGKGGLVKTEDIKKLADSAIVPPDPLLPTESYLVVFATVSDPGRFKGNKAQDEKNGIFHLTLGSDRGIVKTFSFSEKKMPQLRAMNIENASQGSSLILPQDVELTMVGNTFFRNGSILYINAGFALGAEVSKKLGVGGYYDVVKVENTINASRFETRLTCMQKMIDGE